MRNKIVGLMVIGISLLVGFIISSFNSALADIVNESCTHGPACPMWGTIKFQTSISIGIMAFLLLSGIYLVFFSREEKIITRIRSVPQQIKPKKITKEAYTKILGRLDEDEKRILGLLIDAQGSAYQSDIVGKSGFSKVKVTRSLDKMEGEGLVERKRRGMTNIVVLR